MVINQKLVLKNAPTKPGVYLMKDKAGKVIYVGKAKDLKKRLASYFLKKDQSAKTVALMERVQKIETIGVNSETEAFLLENELIKKYIPQFNVIMRDDKNYLYVRITVEEEFPQILLARRVFRDGAKYFGPYASSGAVHEGLKFIKKVFPLCTATQKITSDSLKKGQGRACLNYHLKICPGVCVGKVSSREYHKTIDQVVRFLRGNYEPVIKELKQEMEKLSEKKEYERAARIRDGIRSLETISERQSVVKANLSVNEDALGVARSLNKAMIVLLQVRSGRVLNQQQYAIETKYEAEIPEILAGFLRDYYLEAADFPKVILLPEEIEGVSLFESWMAKMAGRKIKIVVPSKGRQRAVVRLAESNAQMKFNQISGRWKLEKIVATEGVDKLRDILHLKKLERIEAYDISNIQGTDSVGAMVVWEKGKMDKGQYRRFKIKTVVGPNDFASLAEVLRRRFSHQAGDAKFSNLPDVVLIDGGKGQVSTITKALKNYPVVVIGIAKGSHSRTKAKDDLVLSTGKVVILPDNSPTKILLQNIRDEAHRFAIAYHTNLRKKRVVASGLKKIPGVGAVTQKKLVRKFGSLAAVRRASEAEIASVVGEKMAKRIRN